jgi:hypothetical protein
LPDQRVGDELPAGDHRPAVGSLDHKLPTRLDTGLLAVFELVVEVAPAVEPAPPSTVPATPLSRFVAVEPTLPTAPAAVVPTGAGKVPATVDTVPATVDAVAATVETLPATVETAPVTGEAPPATFCAVVDTEVLGAADVVVAGATLEPLWLLLLVLWVAPELEPALPPFDEPEPPPFDAPEPDFPVEPGLV